MYINYGYLNNSKQKNDILADWQTASLVLQSSYRIRQLIM